MKLMGNNFLMFYSFSNVFCKYFVLSIPNININTTTSPMAEDALIIEETNRS